MKITIHKVFAVAVLSAITVFSVEENASFLPEEPLATPVHAPTVPTVIAAEKFTRLPLQGTPVFSLHQSHFQ